MKDIIKLIKKIFLDISKIYINFIHWNISKVAISIWSFLLWLLLALPFIVLLIVLYFSFNLSVYFNSIYLDSSSLFSLMEKQPLLFSVFTITLLLAWLFMLFWYSYRKVLFAKLNFEYLDDKKLAYTKNNYFDFKLIIKYVKVISLVSFFSLIPVFIFLLLFIVIFFIFWWSAWVEAIIATNSLNLFTIISFTLFLVCLLFFIFIVYRLFFSIIILADSKNYKSDEKAFFYLKESYSKTKKLNVLWKFILTLFLLLIVIIPLSSVLDYYSNSLNDINKYMQYQSLSDEQKKQVDESSESYYFNNLKLDYLNKSNQELKELESTYKYLSYLFITLNLLLIFWLYEMAIVSFYKHQIIKKH